MTWFMYFYVLNLLKTFGTKISHSVWPPLVWLLTPSAINHLIEDSSLKCTFSSIYNCGFFLPVIVGDVSISGGKVPMGSLTAGGGL